MSQTKVGFSQDGQPGGDASDKNHPVQGAKGQEQNTNKPTDQQTQITEDRIVEIAKQVAEQVGEQTFSKAQSLIDKKDQKVQDRLQELDNNFKFLKASGVEVPDEVIQAAKRDIQLNTTIPDDTQAQQTDPSQSEDPTMQILKGLQEAIAGPEDKRDPFTIAGEAAMQEVGVEVFAEDPEFEDISFDDGPSYVASCRQAALAKQKRIGGSGSKPSTSFGSGPKPAKKSKILDIMDPVEALSFTED